MSETKTAAEHSARVEALTDSEKFASLPLLEALSPRQIELLLWQIVMDFGGGEIGSTPADDVPGRHLLVSPGENGFVDMCANEDDPSDG